MRKLNKLAAAVAIVLAGSSVPAGAAVLGGAGEALLIPLVVWSGGNFNDPECDADSRGPATVTGHRLHAAVDTVIELWIPGAVGFDDIPNIYTADAHDADQHPHGADPCPTQI